MEITAEKKLTIKVGDSIEMIMNGSNGTVQLKSSKLKIETSGNINVNSNGAVKIQGGNISVAANAMLKMESSGAVTVSGTPIKIG